MAKPTKEQLALFQALHESRKNDFEIFNKKSYRRLWNSIVDKYPESAHFVYELLQNADDAQASNVCIQITLSEMQFKHNGTKHFDITQEEASQVGDINSITGIGDSSKNTMQNKIGKFGVGFKAVFQYTDAPEIYDDIFKFRIDNFIIPTLLDHDYEGRKDGETLFVFPFKNGLQSYHEIVNRTRDLHNPLLFLRHLQEINLQILDEQKETKEISYKKECQDSIPYSDGILLEKYTLIEPERTSSIFLFSKNIQIEEKPHLINVGFYYDEEKKCLITDREQSIFCFFPTQETFDTCFVSHAPFLLTDNRQNLKPSEPLNKELLNQLADLAAKSVLCLRDYGREHNHLLINENIIDIASSYKKNYWGGCDETFGTPIKNAFEKLITNEEVFLSRNNQYLLQKNAYIGTPLELVELLNQEQLNKLLWKNGEVDFLSKGFSRALDNPTFKSDDLSRKISAQFMSQQNKKWVLRFYSFLMENARNQWNVKMENLVNDYDDLGSKYPLLVAPIIKNQKDEWVAPYEDDQNHKIFLPLAENMDSDYNFVNSEYLHEPIAKKFFDEIGIQAPDKYEYVRAQILPFYDNFKTIDEVLGICYPMNNYSQEEDNSVLSIIINYYKEIKNNEDKVKKFIDEVDTRIKLCNTTGQFFIPAYLYGFYIKNEKLENYLQGVDIEKDEIFLLNDTYYAKTIESVGKENFYDFIQRIGGKKYPQIKTKYLYKLPYAALPDNVTVCKRYLDFKLDGFKNKIEKDVSIYVWNEVLPTINLKDYWITYVEAKKPSAKKYKTHQLDTTLRKSLCKDSAWIYDKYGVCHKACNIALEDLAPEYDRNNGLIELLGIKKREKSIIEMGGTIEQQCQMNLGKIVQEFGFSPEQLKEILRKEKAKEMANNIERTPLHTTPTTRSITKENSLHTSHETTSTVEPSEPSIDEKLAEKWEKKSKGNITRPRAVAPQTSIIDFTQKPITPSTSVGNQPFFDPQNVSFDSENVQKEDTNAERRIKTRNTEAQEAAQKAEEQTQIWELLKVTQKYTFKWYKLLMELMHADKQNALNRHIQLDFSEWKFTCSDKILHLFSPSEIIPTWLADANGVVISTLAERPSLIKGAIAKVEESSVDIAIEMTDELRKTCQSAKRIRLVADNPSNIIDSLETRFLQLGFEDDYDMNENLPKNIEFIYGPPGTGKTTKLVEKVSDIVAHKDSVNVLVLTPTNKAADVVAIKMTDDKECFNYLTRFGTTESLYLIEDAAVVTNRDTTKMDASSKNIIVTTAARYAYDCVQPDDTFICDFPWDYIFIDEASMMDILTITYILYKGVSAKIVISGDPMQIEPVEQNNMTAYNVYDLVGLHGFKDAIQNYNRYPVTGLMMQHRSVPSIGNGVSKYAYNGLVEADPNRAPQKPLNLDGMEVRDINFFGFDIADFDLVTGLTAIGGSAFQLYAAIFTYNMAEYIAKQISMKYSNATYSIGIVCPYRAEADAIKQMLESRPVDTTQCKVTCGTVHSFQGDECDIMFVVLNPPAQCSPGTHINNKNIINVAMSRARDYLFFVIPNGQQKGFTLKNDLDRVFNMTQRQVIKCAKIEEIIFGSDNYIATNTHVTCHMPVNVYCEDTAIYEVRMSDDSLDIKINI